MITKDINRLKLLNKIGLVTDEELTKAEAKPLINVEKLNVNFKRGGKLFEAVKNANLKIEDGEVLGLVGESGSGKTTLGRATISLWDHALGKVEIEGKRTPNRRIKSVSKDNLWVYKKGQMIFQDPTSSLNRQSKVLDIVYEGLKNFKTIENEYSNLLEVEEANLEKLIRFEEAISGDKKNYEKYLKEISYDEKLAQIVAKSTDAKTKKFIEDYSKYLELTEKINSNEEALNELPDVTKAKIKIAKSKVASDKLILNETKAADVKFLKESLHHEIEEWEKFQTRFEKDEAATIKRITKRIARFYKQTVNKATKELPQNLRDLLPKDTSSIVAFEKAVKAFEGEIAIEGKLNPKEVFYTRSISLTMQVIVAKMEKVLTPLNSIAYDHNFIFTDDVLMDRVHYQEKLVNDLDRVLEEEKKKLDKVTKDEDNYLINYYQTSIDKLNEYREILLAMVKEYAHISIMFKEKLLNHEEFGIKEFYKFAIKQSKINDSLKASLITWKAKDDIDYINRAADKKARLLENELKSLNEELETITSKYSDLENPKEDLLKFAKKELNAFIKAIKVTDVAFNKEVKKLGKTQEAITESKEKISEYNRILTNKKALKEISIQRIKDTLIKVGLQEDALNKYPSQFSGGQKQRIGIARTIINKPKFIIADEPISALDVSVQAQVINLMKDINEEMGLTMLFIAHDLQMVHYISDKIAVIYRGTIVEYGSADEVYKNPMHPYTKSLIGAMPSLEEVGKPLEVSEYSWAQHEYNEFSITKLHQINKNHFVFGTEEEIKEWK